MTVRNKRAAIDIEQAQTPEDFGEQSPEFFLIELPGLLLGQQSPEHRPKATSRRDKSARRMEVKPSQSLDNINVHTPIIEVFGRTGGRTWA